MMPFFLFTMFRSSLFNACSCLAVSIVLLHAETVKAQTATVVESTTKSLSYTFDNASGFSITNNGTMVYDGPINQLTGSPCCSSATLTVNGKSTTISADDYEADTGLKAKKQGGMTLNSRLDESVIPMDSEIDKVGLQYLVILGGVTKIKSTDSITIQEKVDGQSLSIFPQFKPSVFP